MPDAHPAAPFVPVVPAGGAGTRLWPLSRRDRPKFLLDLTGEGRTLLQQTLDRLRPLADREPVVVTGVAHETAVREQVGDGVRVLGEPSPRNSMPAIALAAALIEREDPDAVIGSFAADHVVRDPAALERAIRSARAAAEAGYLVTLGIEPTEPSIRFGYIERADEGVEGEDGEGQEAAADAPGATATDGMSAPGSLRGTGALPVARFVEKPEQALAEEFVASGRFLWNAGMFVVRARGLLDALAEQIPPLAVGVREIASAPEGEEREEALRSIWPQLLSIAIDHALAEPLAAQGRVAVVPTDPGWDDVGDFASLAAQNRAARVGNEDGNGGGILSIDGAETVGIGARATVYGASDRLVALVGVEDVSVVLTPDALLVIADEHAQDLARLGPELERIGRADLR